jgi:ABC-type transport system involved in multi-copper enzyme maturation permease subunit
MTTVGATIQDALVIARREIAAVFRGRRGVLLSVVLLALAALPAILRALGSQGAGADDLQRAQIATMARLFPRDIVRSLIDCPPPLTIAVIATLFFQPVFVLLVGSEAIAGDVESGTMRFWTPRASRTGILLGKALGLWGTVCALTLFVHIVVWITVAVGPSADPTGVRIWGPKLYLLCCVAALTQVSLVILLGTFSSTPRRARVIGVLLLLVVRIVRTLLATRGVAIGSWFPGALDERLLSPALGVCIGGIALLLAWSAAYLAAATLIFSRRNL